MSYQAMEVAVRYVLGLLVVMALPLHAQEVIFVDASVPPGGDGSSWEEAFDDLQDALDLARTDPQVEQIWIADGQYRPDRNTGNVDVSFNLVAGVGLYGGFAGGETDLAERDPETNIATLTGDLNGDDLPDFVNRADNSRFVMRATELAAVATIDGLHVTGGNADFDGGDFLGGGGLFAERASVDVASCTFTENTAGTHVPDIGNFGGAIYVKGYGTLNVSDSTFRHNRGTSGGAIGTLGSEGQIVVTIENTLFDDNFAPNQTGGAVKLTRTDLEVSGCTFVGNSAGYGGAIFATLANNVVIRDSAFRKNTVDVQTAAVVLDRCDQNDLTPAVIERCIFEDNFTDGGFDAGTLRLEETVTHMTDCIFRRNFNTRFSKILGIEGFGTIGVHFEAGHRFVNCLVEDNFAGFIAGIETDRASIDFINCTIANNRAASDSEFPCGFRGFRGEHNFDNTIFYGNRIGTGLDDDQQGIGGEAVQLGILEAFLFVDHSLIEGLTGTLGGVGNIDGDPLFVDANANDLRLQPGSPAIDAADNFQVPEGVVADLGGNPRFVDDPATEDTGMGEGAIVDMGAYEFQVDGIGIVGANSCRIHDDGGPNEALLCLDLAETNTIEPRRNGARILRVETDADIDPPTAIAANVQATCSAGDPGPLNVALDGAGVLMITFDQPHGNINCCTISFDGVTSTDGAPLTDNAAVSSLAGDLNFSGSVTGGDALLVKTHFGESLGGNDLASPRWDYDLNGAVTGSDFALIKPRFGALAAECP